MTHLQTMTQPYQIEIGPNAAHYYFSHDPQRETATVNEREPLTGQCVGATRSLTPGELETLTALAARVGIKIRKV